MSNLIPSIETLVREIEAVNHVWKEARSLFGDDASLTQSARALKSCLQARLLRTYGPEHVFLAIDRQAEGEELYGLRLRQKIAGRIDAAHLPVRIAREIFTKEELIKFQQVPIEQDRAA